MSVRIFLCLFCAAILLRLLLLFFTWSQPLNIVDEQNYQILAESILVTGEYRNADGLITAMRPPLYPAFLATVYKIAGSIQPNPVRVLHVVLSLLSALLLFQLGRRVWGDREAVLAALLFFLYPSLIFFNALVLSETLFICLFLLFLFFFERLLRSECWREAGAAGFFLALASLTRSIAYPLSVPLVLLFFWLRRRNLSRSSMLVACFVLFFALTLTPWAVRNYQTFGTFAPVGTMGGINLSMGNYEYTPLHNSWAAVEVGGEYSWGHVYRDRIAGLNEGEKQQMAMALAKEYMLENPGQTLLRSLVKLANFWGLERTIIAGMKDDIFPALSSRTLQVVLIPVILIPYIIIVLAGFFGLLWRLLYDRHPFDLVFALIVLGVTAMHSLIFGHSRYHLFLMPVLCGYCSWALFNIRFFWQSHRRRAFSVACPILLMFGSFWTYDVLIGSQDKISQFLENLF
jgi:4-amino-4-deoxy-L-arabinose transferase-like glycosyltransferase